MRKRGVDNLTIHDIAMRCGVSIATVSRVINDSPNVSDTTRKKILNVIREINYTPNAFARGLSLNSMRMIGILCTDVARPFYAQVVSLLERNLREKGFDSMLCCSGYSIEGKKNGIKFLLNKKVDAIILAGAAFNEQKDNDHIADAAKQVPIFLINSLIDIPNVYCVMCDEKEAMRTNVHEMVSAGFNDILYIHDMLTWSWVGMQKLSGYRLGLHECGIIENPNLICAVEHGVIYAMEKTAQLLRDGICFSGVMVSEDILAIGVQKALNKHNVFCPIIGFNNSLLTVCATPTLTSVDNMLDIICPTAVDMLTRLLLKEEHIPTKIEVSASLVERETFQRNNQIKQII